MALRGHPCCFNGDMGGLKKEEGYKYMGRGGKIVSPATKKKGAEPFENGRGIKIGDNALTFDRG